MTTSINNSDTGAADRLLPGWSAQLTTRDGVRLNVRPAAPEDEPALADFFGQATPEDLRFRFLTAVRKIGHDFLEPLVNVDHRRTENLLAFDTETGALVASAMIAADEASNTAEVAIAVRADFKGKGVGWTLLDHAADHARQCGIKALQSIESRDHRQAIGLEKEMGFEASACPGDASLVILSKRLGYRA
ncbi:GNAT family N-acetyltransferase [Allosphingosinicella deserti]|uniref:GNAT family N-acetyltransferase n=1 Tax=Allosphingosinicella deserti TaxID=2116704 RepID=A0A2P7QKU9_9SPHN|nr:GNAT family N-acetyltransferase [Sphingomonas deserti]PSJ38578.1 GNAT family N-acetyltransferase [Sphingomonas deserti]